MQEELPARMELPSHSTPPENGITDGHGDSASDPERQSLRRDSSVRSTPENHLAAKRRGFIYYSQRARRCCAKVNKWKLSTTVLSVLLVFSVAMIIYQSAKPQPVLTAPSTTDAILNPSHASSCPQTWSRHKGRCYVSSDTEETWNASWIHCSSLGGSLVALDTPQEWEFVWRSRRPIYFWLDFRREGVGEPWKWSNGSRFDNTFTIAGDGLCAYMNEKTPMSTYCDSKRHWICTKPEEPF